MNKNEIIYGILVASNDYDRFLKLNLKIYKKIFSEFGNFYIVNVSNLLISKDKIILKERKKKFFSKKIKVFKPKNKNDFLNFFNNKTFVVFNNLGRNLSNLKVNFYLNKINYLQILLMNYGHINNAVELYKQKNIKYVNFTGLKFYIRRKLINYLYRLLILLNIFPKIDIYFESSNQIFNNTYKKIKFRKKIERFIPFEINYFRNIFKINSRSYDNFKKIKKSQSKYICFVDSNIDNLDVVLREGRISNKLKILYYSKLKKLFDLLKLIFKKKILICLHPKNKDPMIGKIFKNYDMVKFKTPEIIRKSYIVLFHDSSAALDAIILKKNLLCIRSKILGNYWNDRIDQYIKKLDLPYINLDKEYKVNKKTLFKKFRSARIKQQKYIINNLQIDNNKLGEDKVIEIIKKFTK
tara:strand:+ start:714 stop:1943 length:1230 start_codon:yes stop_codon:yes gene_type:complete